MGNPHRPVDRGSADGTVSLCQQFARPAAKRPLGVNAEEMKVLAVDHVEYPRVPIAGAYLPQHALGPIRHPVDHADVLGHQR